MIEDEVSIREGEFVGGVCEDCDEFSGCKMVGDRAGHDEVGVDLSGLG